VICEAPTFLGTLGAMRRHGTEIHGVPVDDEGIVTGAVRERLAALRREGRPCKLIYTMPTFHNPAGVTATLARRRELIDLAREYDTLLLEDDAYGALRFAGEQVPSLYALDGGERVVRSGTISKVLGAGLRLGWLVAPRELIPIFQGFNFGGGVNPFVSRVATYYMRENMVEHIETLRDVYRDKRDAMLRGLREGLGGADVAIREPEGGFFLWLALPESADPGRVAQLAAKAHVHYLPGPAFYPDGGGKEFIRLAFSYESPERCYEGAKALGAAIRQACE
jgi:2-aminoadipate transaminase